MIALAVTGPFRVARVSPTGTFATSDGVAIAYWSAGTGRPLLLVHGSATDHRCFDPVLDELAARYATTAYDRRGYGASEDHDDGYSLEREADDLVELAGFVGGGEPIAVLAYSYGGLIALHAVTTRTVPIRALVAYEPPVGVPGMLPATDEILDLIDQGRYEDATRLFVQTTFHLSDGVLDAMARHPMWEVSVELIARVRREFPIVRAFRLAPPAGPVPPTKLLVAAAGGNPAFHDIAALVQQLIPGTEVVPVPGLPHFAMATEPAMFAAQVVAHLDRN